MGSSVLPADGMDQAFERVLESHRDAPDVTASIRDGNFTVQASNLDVPFFNDMAAVLSTDAQGPKQKHNPFGQVQRKLSMAMKKFLAPQSPAVHRAVVTASLSVLRNSCAVSVPSALSKTAVYAVLRALETAAPKPSAVLGLGTEGFPESQMAAFLLDATRLETPPPPTPPITVSADVAVKIMATFGVGAAGKDGLQWGSPDVAGCLRGSVRRVANKLRKDGEWGVFTNLVDHMENRRGVAEIEAVLGFRLGEMIASAMLGEHWEPARRLVSAAAVGEPRKTLARALIPAASDAEAYEIATRLIEENQLESEFPDYRVLQAKAWTQQKKIKLEGIVKKPGWKMAQQMLERGSRNEHELRVWLVQHMIELGNLPAAARLMDHFNLHKVLPPLDPVLVEASRQEIAAAHLQLPIDDSKVVLVDDWQTLQYAEQALAAPPKVGGRGGTEGVSCVGLDVEMTPATSKASLLQVATSTNVFLFDLLALCGLQQHRHRPTSANLSQRFDSVMSALFSSPAVVKLGFGFGQDAMVLRRSWPLVRGFGRIASLLEVGALSDAVLGRENPSLSKTCEAWLGKPLDKTECASKWGHRPLTVDQVRYAALDAHCLVGIFEEMLIERGGRLARSVTNGPPDTWWRDRLADNKGRDAH